VEQAWRRLGREVPFARALDVGCGAGLSTRALAGLVDHCIGLEPAESMLKWRTEVAPDADFLVGTAETLPLHDASVDLIVAAGSLNYVKLELFFPRAVRLLRPGGFLLVYDFSVGSSFRDSEALEKWHTEFLRRYPPPPGEAKTLSPDILAGMGSGFRVYSAELVEAGVTLTPGFYLSYIMTESNVAFALRNGTAEGDIQSWCAGSLLPVWEERPHEVLFRGYFAWMTKMTTAIAR
jgi:SAM-dependent methyltransferase